MEVSDQMRKAAVAYITQQLKPVYKGQISTDRKYWFPSDPCQACYSMSSHLICDNTVPNSTKSQMMHDHVNSSLHFAWKYNVSEHELVKAVQYLEPSIKLLLIMGVEP